MSSEEDDLPELSFGGKAQNNKDSDDDIGDDAGLQDDMDDLFGDDDEEADTGRQLDDHELDSGDDEGRNDRAPQQQHDDEVEDEDFNMMGVAMPRHPQPEPSDGEVRCSLRRFIANRPKLTSRPDLPPQSPALRFHCPRSLLQPRLAAACYRPSRVWPALYRLFRLQNSTNNCPLASLALQSVRASIECPHPALV
jgi:hypothetical protein